MTNKNMRSTYLNQGAVLGDFIAVTFSLQVKKNFFLMFLYF